MVKGQIIFPDLSILYPLFMRAVGFSLFYLIGHTKEVHQLTQKLELQSHWAEDVS